jgi:hypothetical protein
MANYNPKKENLKVIQYHEDAVRLGRKGGSKTSAKKQWTNLKYCVPKCPYSGMCPFMTASMASPDKLCALKQRRVTMTGKSMGIQPDIIESFFSLFENGKEGIIQEALSVLFKLRLKSQNASSDELHEYFNALLNMKKTFYPEREAPLETNIQINIKPHWITLMEAEEESDRSIKHDNIIDATATIINSSKAKDTGSSAI